MWAPAPIPLPRGGGGGGGGGGGLGGGVGVGAGGGSAPRTPPLDGLALLAMHGLWGGLRPPIPTNPNPCEATPNSPLDGLASLASRRDAPDARVVNEPVQRNAEGGAGDGGQSPPQCIACMASNATPCEANPCKATPAL